jgi:CheY-like chemotaxis protein
MAPPTGLPARSRADGDGAARRILVVEDNADAREMLRIVLELAGHEVHEAVDGPSGLATALGLRPDIVLVDIGLPGFDGLEMARRVRHEVGAAIHLIALTGYGQPDDRRLALEAGFDAHLVKPVDPPALLAAIRAVFSAAREA